MAFSSGWCIALYMMTIDAYPQDAHNVTTNNLIICTCITSKCLGKNTYPSSNLMFETIMSSETQNRNIQIRSLHSFSQTQT